MNNIGKFLINLHKIKNKQVFCMGLLLFLYMLNNLTDILPKVFTYTYFIGILSENSFKVQVWK